MRPLICSPLLVALLLMAGPAGAIVTTAGTGGASFVQINQGSARAMALGHSFVALAEGSDSLIWNQAGLGKAGGQAIAIRVPPALFSLCTIWCFYLLLGKLHGKGRPLRRLGLTLGLAASEQLVFFSTQATSVCWVPALADFNCAK